MASHRRGTLVVVHSSQPLTTPLARALSLSPLAPLRSLIILKLLIGINLRAFAVSRYSTMEERAEEDQRNDRSRQPIGTNAGEKVRGISSDIDFQLYADRHDVHVHSQAHESATTRLIQKKEFDSPGGFSGRLPASTANGTTMETLSRFAMVKSRIY